MAQLVKGMFDSGSASHGQKIFGLSQGQCRRIRKLVHNGSWYNAAGEKLGSGDLAADDLYKISVRITNGEVFIVVGEIHSGPADAPSVDFVAATCRYIIAKGQRYWVDRHGDCPEDTTVQKCVQFTVVKSDAAKTLIAELGRHTS